MYHVFLEKEGFESYILNDEIRADRKLIHELWNHTAYKHFDPQKTYKEAERRLNKALIGAHAKMDGMVRTSLKMNVKPYEHMPKRVSTVRYDNYTPELTISTIPEIRNVVSIGTYYNSEFEYYVFYAIKHVTDENNEPKVDIWYKPKFSKPANVISACLYCIATFANRFPGYTLLAPFAPIAMAFERGWVRKWIDNNVYVERIGQWRYVYSLLSKRKYNCKVVYNPPDIDDEYYKTYIDSEVFRHHYRHLQEANPSYYDKMYDLYYNQARMPEKIILRNVTELD